MKKMETTLLLLRRENEILLAKKKRGFGTGKYNGVGGKIESGETVEDAMIRECIEEIHVTPTKYEKMGTIEFIEFVKNEKTNLTFHLFVATSWIGEPKESEEMKPKWFKLDEIPYNEMFIDDSYWLPIVLEGNKVKAFFEFDEDWNLLSYNIEKMI